MTSFSSQQVKAQQARGVGASQEISGVLMEIVKDHNRYQEFIVNVQRVIPEFSNFTVRPVEVGNNLLIEYITRHGGKHISNVLGEGVISVLVILIHLLVKEEENPAPLIIDEPELSLHPLAQRRLLGLLAEHSQNRQIIISTHSPQFVSWEYIKNGATLNRVTKYDDKKSEIHTLKSYEITRV